MLSEKVVAVCTDVNKREQGARGGVGFPGSTVPTWPHVPIIMPMTKSIRDQRNPQ